ncbi:MAG: hypothetical protein HYY18_08445 [Planctomycetes bacterium]|nr:hypothetical protein [Planctomycetota bacterium]
MTRLERSLRVKVELVELVKLTMKVDRKQKALVVVALISAALFSFTSTRDRYGDFRTNEVECELSQRGTKSAEASTSIVEDLPERGGDASPQLRTSRPCPDSSGPGHGAPCWPTFIHEAEDSGKNQDGEVDWPSRHATPGRISQDEETRRAMASTFLDFECSQIPICEAVQALSEESQMNIVVDGRHVSLDTVILGYLRFERQPLNEILTHIAERVGLVYCIDMGLIVLTTPQAAAELESTSRAVGDLSGADRPLGNLKDVSCEVE